MDLSDRDYMHRQQTNTSAWRAFRPNRLTRSPILMTLTLTAMLALIYKTFLWWDAQNQINKILNPNARLTPQVTIPKESKRIHLPPATNSDQPNSTSESEKMKADTRIITKCLLNGQVIFTDSQCPGGSKSSSVTVNIANVGTVAPPLTPTATPRIQQQVVTNASNSETVSNASPRNSECTYLEEQIKQIDAMARQPLSGQSQDVLSAQRKKFRSRQFELRC